MISCYFCGNSSLRIIQRKLRHEERRNVYQCRRCGLVFLMPAKKNLKKFYQTEEYRKKHSPTLGKAMTAREIFEMNVPLQAYRISKIRHLLGKSKKVLDVGCSTGHFLYAIRSHVKTVTGIELNKTHAAFARKKGITVYDTPIQETRIAKEYFDIIFLHHVLEHIEKPKEFLASLRPYLSKGGRFVVEVPNVDDPLLSVYTVPSYRQFYFHDAHLFYYSHKTLLRMLQASGFHGKVEGFQLYNFLNHMHWLSTGKPQPNATIALGTPQLPFQVSGNKTKKDINNWVKKIDLEYRALLEKRLISDCLLFIGKKK